MAYNNADMGGGAAALGGNQESPIAYGYFRMFDHRPSLRSPLLLFLPGYLKCVGADQYRLDGHVGDIAMLGLPAQRGGVLNTASRVQTPFGALEYSVLRSNSSI